MQSLSETRSKWHWAESGDDMIGMVRCFVATADADRSVDIHCTVDIDCFIIIFIQSTIDENLI